MTLQQAKDQVAKKNGFKDWTDLESDWLKRTGMAKVVHENYVLLVAELYAQSQVNEALGAVDQLIRTGRGADIEYKSWLSGQIEKLKSGLPSNGGMKTN